MTKILILGGTKEAAKLASDLIDKGNTVITSLAGRTKEPKPVAGEIRVGGFGGVSGLVSYIQEHDIKHLIDATHPFAKQISKNAKAAAAQTQIQFEVKQRAPWQKQTGDNWIEVDDLTQARDAVPTKARVLLALGSQHIDLFKTRHDVFFLVRMVDPPNKELPLPSHKLLIGRPSSDWEEEAAILHENSITHIVCRNSGGTGAYAKIKAARDLKLPVIMVQR
jgi:precorrin-6A/cobalt-precorrin-6A reductase